MKEIFGATTKTNSSSNLNFGSERNEASYNSSVNKNSVIVKEENIFDENNSSYTINMKAPTRDKTLGISRTVIEQATKRLGFKKKPA